jgi:hypothetical protein
MTGAMASVMSGRIRADDASGSRSPGESWMAGSAFPTAAPPFAEQTGPRAPGTAFADVFAGIASA